MTKFILHGGYTSIDCENNKNFFLSAVEGLENPKTLLVYFAREEDTWDERYKEDKGRFKGETKMASKENFSEEIEEADVIYLRGGDTELLLTELREVDFKDLIEGKVVAGSSAGAYALVKYFYNNDNTTLKEGLGILNVKVFCHYTDDDKENLENLKNYKEDLKTYVLRDGEFVVVNEEGELEE